MVHGYNDVPKDIAFHFVSTSSFEGLLLVSVANPLRLTLFQ